MKKIINEIKFKALGIALMVSIILGIVVQFQMGTMSVQYAISGSGEFLGFLATLCVVLFGSLAALALDSVYDEEEVTN